MLCPSTTVAIFNSRAEFLDALCEALNRKGFAGGLCPIGRDPGWHARSRGLPGGTYPQYDRVRLPPPLREALQLPPAPEADRRPEEEDLGSHHHRQEGAGWGGGASGVIEIVLGEPYSIGEVVEAVHHALSDGRLPGPESQRL